MHYNIRVAEVLRTISRAGDVALARPLGFGQRVASLALRLAEPLQLPNERRAALLLAGLLHGVGAAGVGGPLARVVLGNERRYLAEFPVDHLIHVLSDDPQAPGEEPPTGVYVRHHLQIMLYPELTRRWLSQAGLAAAAEIAGALLERWDGQGAPRGLAQHHIPVEARVLTLAYYLAAVRLHTASPGAPLWSARVDLRDTSWLHAGAGRLFDPALIERAAALWDDPGAWREPARRLSTSPPGDAPRPEDHQTVDTVNPSTLDDVQPADSAPPGALGAADLIRRYVLGMHDVDEDVPDIDRHIDNLLYDTFGAFLEPTSPRLDAWLGLIATMTDAKGAYEEGHSRRTAALAQDLGLLFELSDAQLIVLRLAGLLFATGRLAVPSALIESSATLTGEQRRVLQEYPRVTRSILSPLVALGDVIAVAAMHAERLDGSGYPEGLTGDATPVAARILAVASTYMSLIVERPYRPAYARSRALAILQAQSGALFDGLVTDSLEAVARGLV